MGLQNVLDLETSDVEMIHATTTFIVWEGFEILVEISANFWNDGETFKGCNNPSLGS